MKINWGTGIAIFYGLFVVVMVAMVVLSAQEDINMVQDNYYDKDLNYEAFRKSRENGSAMLEPVEINYEHGRGLTLSFPKDIEVERGEVTLYRPSDRNRDQQLPLALNEENEMEIVTTDLVSGPWRILLSWSSSGQSYYKEKHIIL